MLSPGSRIGPYELVSLLGKGGMGEVYRAKDLKLGRDVAIKILPEPFASDPDRLARFQREAQVLASLNHPNIAAIYGLEESVGTKALVLELVPGETLADRIARGPIPLDEALPIARQIAEALEAAHEQGIIHRDLKPANIKITPDGAVKVLDFGLAKLQDASATRGSNASLSPTITSPALMTGVGVLLGTAAYMSPEQARGRPVDKRADIWAFGAVVYELATARKAFDGDDVAELVAKILQSEPLWDDVPVEIQRLLRKCLEKDPKNRLRDIGDVWELLDRTRTGAPPRSVATPGTIAWLACALAFGIAGTLGFRQFNQPAAKPAAVIRFQVPLPDGVLDPSNVRPVISPDGLMLATAGFTADGRSHLWVRSLDSLVMRELAGAESRATQYLAWSPDSRYLAYNIPNALMKIDVRGGPPEKVCDLPLPLIELAWNDHGTIAFGTLGGGIMRAPASGGIASPVTELPKGHPEVGHFIVTFLPGGNRFLYVAPSGPTDVRVFLGDLDRSPTQQDHTELSQVGLSASRVRTSGAGRPTFVFMRGDTLVAQHFDGDHLRLEGDALQIADRVFSFSISDTGVLVYNNVTPIARRLTWLDRRGKQVRTSGDAASYTELALSPDGAQAAVTEQAGDRSQNIWIVDLVREATRRLTFAKGAANYPVWSPDGRTIAFSSDQQGGYAMYAVAVDGTSPESMLMMGLLRPTDWTRDGRFLVYASFDANTKADIWAMSMDSTHTPTRLVATPFADDDGAVSPDGRWLTYTSDDTGRLEVFARPFSIDANGRPSVGAPIAVSKGGGNSARWRRDGKELLYRSLEGAVMGVELTRDAIPFGPPRVLFKRSDLSSIPAMSGDIGAYDFTKNGEQLLVAMPDAHSEPSPFTVVVNWDNSLKP